MPVGLENIITLFGGGAAFSATVSGGGIATVPILRGGCYYAAAPTLAAVPNGGDVITTPAVLTAVLTNGVVTGVTIGVAGVGYAHVPTITVTLAVGASSLINSFMSTDALYSVEQYRQAQTAWTTVGGISVFAPIYPDVPSMMIAAIRDNVVTPALKMFPTGPVVMAQAVATSAVVTVESLITGSLATPIVPIQSVAGSTAPGSTTASLSLAAATYSDTLIVCISTAATSAPATVTSIVCSNVVFTRVSNKSSLDTLWGGYLNLEVWAGTVNGSLSGTSIAVTFSLATDTYYTEMTAAEFSGVAFQQSGSSAAPEIDGAPVQFQIQTSLSAVTVGPYFNTDPSDLIFAVLQADIAGPPTTPAGFTALASGVHSGSWGLWPVFQVAGVIGSFSPDWSGGFGGGATDACAIVVGFPGA